jgi:hypothetical protein
MQGCTRNAPLSVKKARLHRQLRHLETLATILGGSFLFNLVIQLLWFIIVLFAPAWYYAINEKWFARLHLISTVHDITKVGA